MQYLSIIYIDVDTMIGAIKLINVIGKLYIKHHFSIMSISFVIESYEK